MKKITVLLVAGVLSSTVGGVAHAAQVGFKCKIIDTLNRNFPFEFHISIDIPKGQTHGQFYRVGHYVVRGHNEPDGTMSGRADELKTPTGIQFYRVNWWTVGGPANLSITLDGAHSTFNIMQNPAQTGICTVGSFRPIPAPAPAKR